MATISRSDLDLAHTNEIAALAAKRDAAVSSAENAIREARSEHDRIVTDLRQRHAAELEKRHVSNQRAFEKSLRPLVDAFRKEDSRAIAGKLAEAYRAANSRYLHECGVEFDPWALGTLFAAALIDEKPEVIGAFVSGSSRHFVPPAADMGNAGVLCHRLITSGADLAAVREALLRLEAATAILASSGIAAPPDAKERFEILRTGGSASAIEAKLRELDAVFDRARSEAAGQAARAMRAKRAAERSSDLAWAQQ